MSTRTDRSLVTHLIALDVAEAQLSAQLRDIRADRSNIEALLVQAVEPGETIYLAGPMLGAGGEMIRGVEVRPPADKLDTDVDSAAVKQALRWAKRYHNIDATKRVLDQKAARAAEKAAGKPRFPRQPDQPKRLHRVTEKAYQRVSTPEVGPKSTGEPLREVS